MLEILFFYCYAKCWRFDQDLNNLSNIIRRFIYMTLCILNHIFYMTEKFHI
jgi:hypothetical protein